MKSTMFFFIALLFFSSCENENITPNDSLDNIEIKNTQTKVLKNGGVEYTLYANSIEDSRCPEGVECVWAGEAKMILNLKIDGEEFKGLKLCLDCPQSKDYNKTVSISTKKQKYIIQLNDILPKPKKDVANMVSTAYLSIL